MCFSVSLIRGGIGMPSLTKIYYHLGEGYLSILWRQSPGRWVSKQAHGGNPLGDGSLSKLVEDYLFN